MKIWTLEVSLVRTLGYYTCYCDEDPVKLLLSDGYVDTLYELQDNLYNEFGYMFKEELTDADTEDWDDEDFDEWEDSQFSNFCDSLHFEARKVETDEGNEILIDERIDN